VKLSLFGGDPVEAQFVLGYENGKDYFATAVEVPLGSTGVVLIPELLSLYTLSGGLAYNFDKDVFKYTSSITAAQPDFKGTTQFMAGYRIGSTDGFLYTLDGNMVIGSSGSARLGYGAWLASYKPKAGTAPLKGYLEYANGSLDGAIYGRFTFLSDQVVDINLGTEDRPSCSLHLKNKSDWHIYAGNKDGSRIDIKLLNQGTQGYLMLDPNGFNVGGRETWDIQGGVGVSAYAKGWMDMGLGLHLGSPQISGDFGAGLEAGICLSGVGCVSAGVDANVHVRALPLSISADCSIDLPWPMSDYSFTVQMIK
jgi:hypothetical protein